MAKRHGVPVVPWERFMRRHFIWRQGEHVSIVGRTGGGKTTLATGILPKRSHVVVFANKIRDPVVSDFKKQGYTVLNSWGNIRREETKIVLWPKFKKMSDVSHQRAEFKKALDEILTLGDWAIYIDEAYWVSEDLKLRGELKVMWQQGRSLGVSIVAGTQRPVHVPLEMWTQATHVFMLRVNNFDDLRRMQGIGAWDPELVRKIVPRLRAHEALYLDTVNSKAFITKPPKVS